MLLYIYTDKVPEIHEITGSASMCSSTIMVQHLLAAADLYNLDRLKLLCEAKLSEEINADTVATTLALAYQHHCPQLKSACLKFAVNPTNLGDSFFPQHLGAVMQSEGFKHLEESCYKPLQRGQELKPAVLSSRKRIGSSVYGVDLADGGGAAKSVNPNGRQLRRRF